MNSDTPADDASILYYDADYPSLELGPARGEDAAALARMGMLGDVAFYAEQARAAGGPVLEIGCGTGRLTIPLARAGVDIHAVDVSEAMLGQLRAKLAAEPPEVRARVHVLRQDAAALELPGVTARLAILPFNLLMLLPDREEALRVVEAAARHLAPGGAFALDVMNPATLPWEADPAPVPSRPRLNPRSGNPYIRHAQASAVDSRKVQRLAGWYDELLPDGGLRTTRFAFDWRMVDRAELEGLLRDAGLTLDGLAGDFDGAAWTPDSRRIVATGHRNLAGHR
ncbi:class I SAM-dependent methyltransferase [Azospirillum doebereinerae]|uniref:Methyltransferase domain-containing protein n=1 Tax=Azospirillum doebereinerae TaxID=92933 RepID=A0A433J2G5_9PROT|nr:class I SAM-dependent methyltransferase [Azospirillum doebereinerae]MCG5243037.1 methyltransferase domain-containing protein [Azospirillum doebereinerae]RUQ65888.1 methyltransferase domain-containing protein [Azospirillum doebereinerae]